MNENELNENELMKMSIAYMANCIIALANGDQLSCENVSTLYGIADEFSDYNTDEAVRKTEEHFIGR